MVQKAYIPSGLDVGTWGLGDMGDIATRGHDPLHDHLHKSSTPLGLWGQGVQGAWGTWRHRDKGNWGGRGHRDVGMLTI